MQANKMRDNGKLNIITQAQYAENILCSKILKIIKIKFNQKITRENDIKNIFNNLRKNYWGDKESYSGPGSNNKNTKKLVITKFI